MTTTLTRERILTMPAGRELDALVAEKVMGYVLTPLPSGGYACSPSGRGVTLSVLDPLPPYSTDIAAAWNIVKKLQAQEWLTMIIVVPPGSPNWDEPPPFVVVKFMGKRGSGSVCHEAKEPTTPLAICRAALLAVTES